MKEFMIVFGACILAYASGFINGIDLYSDGVLGNFKVFHDSWVNTKPEPKPTQECYVVNYRTSILEKTCCIVDSGETNGDEKYGRSYPGNCR